MKRSSSYWESGEDDGSDCDYEFFSNVEEKNKLIVWRIENIHQSLLKPGGFFESKKFYFDQFESPWTLRFYKTLNISSEESDTAGLYINPLRKDPFSKNKLLFFKCRFSYKRYLLSDSSEQPFPFPTEGDIEIEVDSTQPTPYGTNNLFDSKSLDYPQTLEIKCNICFTKFIRRVNMIPDSDTDDRLKIDHDRNYSNYTTLKTDLFYMLESSSFFDVTLLMTDDSEFPAHKAILASRSKKFDEMFSNMTNNQIETGIIEIENIDYSTMHVVLEYIYSGVVDDLTIERAMLLYPIASKYLLEELKEWCTDVILDNLSVEVICKVAVLVELDPDPDPKFKKAVFDMFCYCTGDIFKRKDWQDLVRDSDHQMLVSKIFEAVSTQMTTFPSTSNLCK